MSIEAALEAARRDDWATALRATLVAWQRTRDPRLAAAIERLGPRAAATLPLPTGERWTERNKLWFAAARRRDPIELHHVLEAACDVRGDAELIARLQKLEKIEDPRVATALRAIATDKRHWYDAGRYIAARLAHLEVAHAPIAAFDDDGAIAALLAACERRAADAEDAAHEAALLAAIYAAPADDGPRLVYADWLQAKNDPRGELIALQTLAGGAGSERARGLVALHGERWLGPLAPHVARWGQTFARGFLAACRVEPGKDGARPPEHPAWATIEQTTGMLPPLASARGLRQVGDLDHAELLYLARFPDPPPIVQLGLGTWRDDYDPRAGTWDAASREASAALVEARPRLPALRALHLSGSASWAEGDGMAPAVLIWPWRDLGIAEVVIRTAFAQLAAWIAVAGDVPGLETLELQTFGEYGYRYQGWYATIARGDDGALSALRVVCAPDNTIIGARRETAVFAAGLALVPPDALTRITVTLPKRGLVDGSPELAMCLAAIDRQRRLATRVVEHRGKR